MGIPRGKAPEGNNDDRARRGGGLAPSASLTPEKRAALCALSYDAVLAALDADDPAATALASEHIAAYSEQVGERLKRGKDYLDLLTPPPHAPAIERIAMELVLETVEDELAEEDV